jgi:prepilin-type N-terminal cleavage/methylation domain-containing protein
MTTLRTDHGISLIEVLAALTVFALVAAGAATGTIATIRGNTASRDATAAAALIHDKLEQLRALDPAGNPADLSAGQHNDPLNPVSDIGQAGGIYTRSWAVTRNSPRSGLAEVRVTVSWKDSAPRTLTSATYVCLTTTCS